MRLCTSMKRTVEDGNPSLVFSKVLSISKVEEETSDNEGQNLS